MLDRGYFRPAKKDEEEEEGVLRRTNVHLVSCHSGMGIDKLMGSLMGMAMDHGNKVTRPPFADDDNMNPLTNP